ncbi:MAG: UDP-N-acetylmuramate--L-alanine ligase [Arsenophonus endosymbiont of Ceratovacuna japonica]
MNIQQSPKLKITIPKILNVKHIHFIGIGGIGMGGIAAILVKEGYEISGSDLIPNTITKQLIELGVKIYFHHKPKNVINACVVVISSAISINNPEVIAAKKARIPVIHRAEMLSELMRFRYGIAISGTHGKTTTTSMIISIYIQSGLDPTFINGGIIKKTGVYANLGTSKYLITEADESDASFLYLHPLIIVITNIEADHMENYDGNFEKLKQTFINFLHNLPFYGRAVLCIDDIVIRSLLSKIDRYVITYGFSDDADIRITSYNQSENKNYFTIIRKNHANLNFILNTPGYHNALNAAAAIAVSTEEGINDNDILTALTKFQGTKRRFDFIGNFSLMKVNGKKGNVILIDDYGHHPTEIDITIKTAKIKWINKRIVMVFQPHRYTRTRDLYNDFVNILEQVDVLLMLDVYPAGEKHIPGADSISLCQTIRNRGKLDPIFINRYDQTYKILIKIIENNDLILTQGAGNISNMAFNLVNKYFR